MSAHAAGSLKDNLHWHANLGLSLIGDQALFSIPSKDAAAFASLGLHWGFRPNWQMLAQIDAREAVFESDIPEIAEPAVQIGIEVRRFLDPGEFKPVYLEIYFGENREVNHSADFLFGARLSYSYN